MKKVLTIAAAVGFVTIPSIAFANAGADNTTAAKPATAKVSHVENEVEHGAEVRAVATNNSVTNPAQSPAPTAPATTTVSEAEARTIAQNTKANAVVTGSELETEHGILVFEIKFSDGSKVYVDATTGEIVSNLEQEDEDENEDHDNSGPSANSGRGSSNSGSGNSDRR